MKQLIIICLLFLYGCSSQKTIHNEQITTILSTTQSITTPSYGEIYAHMTCERIGLDKDIYYGDDEQSLDNGLGQYSKSHLFGEGSVILIAGHNGTHFKELKNIELHDTINVSTAYGAFSYEVYDITTKKVNEFSESELTANEEILIMYTCYPFDALETNERFFVYARLIKK